MTTAIKIEGLSKKYLIGHHRKDQYTTFGDVLMHKFRGIRQRVTHPLSPNREVVEQEELWALRDINLEIKQGERVGLIGRNGAGKSTLLKVLSRITEPTEGRFILQGRVASLLEVGTGFHPELTGRENIFLNGAILGMSMVEIKRKFDEIVDFAETEKFLDTPVKRYSSGMYVRLAFAVAAHLEPDILIVDEVLAVGDASFQKKCLGKMSEVSGEGRTVLFVSHNMGAILALCENAILLKNGKLARHGSAEQVVNEYSRSASNGDSPVIEYSLNQAFDAQIKRISVINDEGEVALYLPYSQTFEIKIEIQVHKRIRGSYLGFHIHDSELKTLIFSRHFIETTNQTNSLDPGIYKFKVKCPASLLVPGEYCVSVHLVNDSPTYLVDGSDYVCNFELKDTGSETAKRGFPWRGSIAVPMEWKRYK